LFLECIDPHTLVNAKEGRSEVYLRIRLSDGIIVEGVLLAQRKNRMRVVVAGFPDTIELKGSGSQWFTASDQPVEFDFLMSCTYQGESGSASAPARVARAVA
jgi:hypothetical protein